MNWLGTALEETAESPHPESFERFQSDIPTDWIEDALKMTGKATLRRRRLPAEQVVWLVIGMAMMRDRPITEVASKLDLILPDRDDTPIAGSAIVEARKRVGDEPLKWLFEKCANQWAHASAARDRWHDLSLYAADGTTLRVPDSDENREHFGLARGPRADSGYPMLRLVALTALRSHIVAAAAFGPFNKSEHQYASELWTELPNNSLTLIDRGFLGAKVLLGIQHGGLNRHWLTRAKSNSSWEVLESFGRFDKLVEFNVSSAARAKNPELPETFTARAISYKHPDSKGRQWLLTSLCDAEKYPASEFVALYHERWEIEIGYDELKTHMLEREECIRSRTVTGLKQEVWGILLAFNLVRLDIERIAKNAKVPPNRISFTMALRLIRDEWLWCAIGTPGTIPKKLQRMREQVARFVLPPRRSHRRFRREVKIKMSSYPKKTRKPLRTAPRVQKAAK